MRAIDATAAGVSRADLTRALVRCSAGLGRDLVELAMLRRHPTASGLWDRYGAIDYYPQLDLRTLTVNDGILERRAYFQCAQIALARMMFCGLRDRNGTHFRWAGAMLEELTSHPSRRASFTWRAHATESRFPEWRDRCDAVYQGALEACRGQAIEASVEVARHVRDIRGTPLLDWLRTPVLLPI